MSIESVLISGVRIGTGDDHHAQFPATCHQLAKRISLAQILATMVKSDLRRIIRDASTGAEAGCIGMGPFEIIEPELWVKFPRIILDQRELSPPHWFVDPGRRHRFD